MQMFCRAVRYFIDVLTVLLFICVSGFRIYFLTSSLAYYCSRLFFFFLMPVSVTLHYTQNFKVIDRGIVLLRLTKQQCLEGRNLKTTVVLLPSSHILHSKTSARRTAH